MIAKHLGFIHFLGSHKRRALVQIIIPNWLRLNGTQADEEPHGWEGMRPSIDSNTHSYIINIIEIITPLHQALLSFRPITLSYQSFL